MTQAHKFTMTISGRAIGTEEEFNVTNPATEMLVGSAPDCTHAQLDEAVKSSRQAFPGWAATPIEERRAVLIKMADRIVENTDELKRILTSEQGKSYDDAEKEVLGASLILRAATSLDLPVNVVEDTPERKIETRHVPLGVVAGLAPWNFPLLLGIMKVSPALLAGNTMILKPSPFSPLATLRLGELVADLLPPGVLNVVSGSNRLGPWITEHSDIDKVSFTGSTQTGRRVMQSAATTLKRVTLELGGNDAAIVLPDVNVGEIAEKLFWAAFRNAGQVCVATKRMYVHEDIYDSLKDALVRYAQTVKVGDGSEQGNQMGPINNRAQYERVLDLIRDAKEKGYKFAVGGDPLDVPGYFVPISIVDNPPETSRIVQEEQFGPVLPLLRYRDLDEVIARVNNTQFGLGNSVWSGDYEKAVEVGERLNSGMVWINEPQMVHPLASFGGWKQSGIGSEGGVEGLLAYTVTKTFVVRKISPTI